MNAFFFYFLRFVVEVLPNFSRQLSRNYQYLVVDDVPNQSKVCLSLPCTIGKKMKKPFLLLFAFSLIQIWAVCRIYFSLLRCLCWQHFEGSETSEQVHWTLENCVKVYFQVHLDLTTFQAKEVSLALYSCFQPCWHWRVGVEVLEN